MSFILDALRKSEHERQRTATPGIAQVPVGAPRRELPLWAVAVIVARARAVRARGGAWLRGAGSAARQAREGGAAAEIPLARPSPATAALPVEHAAAREAAPRAADVSNPVRSAPTAASPSPGLASVPAAAGRTQGPAALRLEPSGASTLKPELTLPSPAALAAEGVALPPLRLELHAFAESPADRFVFINGTKYVEGATLAEGPKVISIAPNGAVLAYHGYQFLLTQ